MSSSPFDADHLPVLDLECIRDLGEDLGNPAAARDFLATYLELLPARLVAVMSTVSVRDSNAAMDRVISLKVSSSMAGALRLSALSAELELMVRAAAWRSADAALALLAEAAAAVQAEGSRAGF
ncbi:conserved hypothetical protein [Arthrobacter sp. 9AX]|uniref:Hpt domain-containing protein n=1 Tax=Arthrobacter sp. 9AX TaxID=2653131 RepID=UPI0012EFF43C|nr:Hpt domain-containing protein [Arthrobacter sp. 9AX]VXB78948.1 conserved hypothetical protein [Arthrobacter sp. 9AX]